MLTTECSFVAALSLDFKDVGAYRFGISGAVDDGGRGEEEGV